jgi:deazaflavin-dependent oxidoreductase (nitroreductase family)
VSDWNERIIAEFRANDGVVGGPFAGSRLMLITTIGAKSGERRVTPVAFADEGDTRILVAAKAGSLARPGWFHNAIANPSVHVEAAVATGIDEYDAVASLYPESDRERRYRELLENSPVFAEFWTGDKVIPLVVLTRSAR